MRKLPDRRFLALLLVGLVALTSCFRGGRSGVNVKALAANLVFGIPPLSEAVPPADIAPYPEQHYAQVFEKGRPRAGGFIPAAPPSPSEPPCLEAEPTDFPEKESRTFIEGKPQVGEYRWAVVGAQEVPGTGTAQLSPLVRKQVTEVKATAGKNFQFTTVESELSFGSSATLAYTFEVREEESDVPGQERGIYLLKYVRSSANTKPLEFKPQPGIKIFPLPVDLEDASTFDGAGVDPTTQEVFKISGKVLPRRSIDACGSLVQMWFVDAEVDFVTSRGDAFNKNYDFGVATQFGGMIVFEHVDRPKDKPTLKYEARLGQIEPSPLGAK